MNISTFINPCVPEVSMTKYLFYTAATSVLILSGCGGHDSSAKVLVPKIESYKAALGTMVGCGKQIEGAKELISEAEGSYKSRAFKKYIDSAMKEIGRAEKTCDKYERFKGEASTPQENLEKMSASVVDGIKSALTVIENGISQQEAYKAVGH